jgi:hypothetical protein
MTHRKRFKSRDRRHKPKNKLSFYLFLIVICIIVLFLVLINNSLSLVSSNYISCKDNACYNQNLKKCLSTEYAFSISDHSDLYLPFYSANIVRKIKGIDNNMCVLEVNQIPINNSKDMYPAVSTVCNIPLRNGTYNFYNYEASYFCKNVYIGTNTLGVFSDSIADSKNNCISMKDFNITRYKKYNYDYYQVKIPDDFYINGYKFKIWNGRYNAMVCKFGTTNLTKDFYYCGSAILEKSFYNAYGYFLYDDKIYEKMVFDRNFNYIKTECFNDIFLKNKISEII